MTTVPHPTFLDDVSFLEQFEDHSLDPAQFSHQGHLRLAWLYFNGYDESTAMRKISSGINGYANSLGAKDKYHATITDAMSRIVCTRIKQATNSDWESFINNNQDLLVDAMGLLLRHYSRERLFSDEARISVVPADIKAI